MEQEGGFRVPGQFVWFQRLPEILYLLRLGHGPGNYLFRMPGDAKNAVRLAVEQEMEAVMVVDAGLPYIRDFAILLGSERGMLEV